MNGSAEPSTGKLTTPATTDDPPRSPLLLCRALSCSLRYSTGIPFGGSGRSILNAAGDGAASAFSERAAASASTVWRMRRLAQGRAESGGWGRGPGGVRAKAEQVREADDG
ncbi:hypothetical protein GUJ93_ZPchr0003g16607 [Zizania palustris]|uniref:Uncharacterized protein n=1 Tax=Zizania palustris TaxID=103762 RepID=A0A8J5S2R4_ZIZPA|nr:hypothetical protein GUJ93_ZPchr0003g16607 [Zizania palustris]